MFNLSLLLSFVFSCSTPIEHDEQFTIYLNKFITEANSRNYKIDITKFDVRINFSDLKLEYEGKCKLGKIKQITINESLWQKLDTLQRELLIFHELGHCVLGRGHKNETFPTGECKSIMDGKEEDFECSNNYYCPYWKSYYLDELFNPEQKSPSWYKDQITYFDIKKAKKIIYDKTLSDVYKENKYGILSLPSLDFSKNIQIDLTSKFDTLSKGGMLINFKNFIFNYNKKSKRINIKKTNGKGSRNNFYYTNSFFLKEKQNRISIRKEGNYLYFLVNNKLLHTMQNYLSNDLKLEEPFLMKRMQIRGKILNADSRLSIFEY